MLKTPHIIRQSAKRLAQAADATVNSLVRGRVQQEPAFTDRMLGRIEEAMNNYVIKGIQWNAMTLTDRGRGAQESRYGADFLGVLDISIDGYEVTKGFLAQAKLIEPGESLSQNDFDAMVEQCEKMLAISPASFLFVYSRSGITVVPALVITGLAQRTNPHELFNRSSQRFFEEYFECFFGDRRLNDATIETLDELRDRSARFQSRTAQVLKARRVNP